MSVIINGIVFADRSTVILNGVADEIDFIQAKNAVHSTTTVWQREIMPVVPAFIATEDQFAQITFAWDMNPDAVSWDLYDVADMVTPIIAGVTSPYILTYSGSADFIIRANANLQVADGYTDSEPDRGEGLIAGAGNVTIGYNVSPTGNNPETVTGSGASWSFTPPAGINLIHVQMTGGAGGGGGGESGGSYSSTDGNGATGGGISLVVDSDQVVVAGTPYAIVIGGAGAGGDSGDTGDKNNGQDGGNGGTTTYAGGMLTVIGGLGGIGGGHTGDAPGSDGTAGASSIYGTGGAGGGQDDNGFAGGVSAGGGGGGGGDSDSFGDGDSGGSGAVGGAGRCVISWQGVGKNQYATIT